MSGKGNACLLEDRKSRLLRRFKLAFKPFDVFCSCRKKITVDPLKVAVDFEFFLQSFNAINRRLLAFAPGACEVFPAYSDEFAESVVAC